MMTVPVSGAAPESSAAPLGIFPPEGDPVSLTEAMEAHDAADVSDLFGDVSSGEPSDAVETTSVEAAAPQPVEPPQPEATQQPKTVPCVWDEKLRLWVPVPTAEVPEEAIYVRKLREAEQEHSEAALEVVAIENQIAALKEQLKEARETHKACAQRLNRLKKNGEAQLEFFDSNSAAVVNGAEPAKVSAESTAEGSVSAAQHEAESSDAWRKVSIEELFQFDMKGVGPKKKAKLVEAVPTIGALTDLYEKCGPGGLKTVLPDGFGEEAAQVIEDAMLAWLSKNRDSAIFDPAAGAAHAATDAGETEATEEPTEEPAEALADAGEEDREAAILARRDELAALKPGDEDFERIRAAHPDMFEIGALAAQKGDPVTSTIRPEGPSRDAFILGHLNPTVELPPTE